MEEPSQYIERDISWLAFNHRVLQEAENPGTPLYERIKFLAIYSSNLDEFYRVRVASLRSFRQLKKSTRKALEINPKQLLKEIRETVDAQQKTFGRIFTGQILPALAEEGIHLVDETAFGPAETDFARAWFRQRVAPVLEVRFTQDPASAPFLKNKVVYLLATFGDTPELALVEIPVPDLPRFVPLPSSDENHTAIAFLDDIIRCNLPEFLNRPVSGIYALKFSRDAELYIDDEYDGDLLEKIKKGLDNRHIGLPTRVLYDSAMPPDVLAQVKQLWGLNKNDLIPGARYHNFHDFFSFPDPKGHEHLHFPPLPALPCPALDQSESILSAMEKRDIMLHFPYHRYDYVLRLLGEAASDPVVKSIRITLYRVADPSEVINALLEACRNGKEVVVFIEAKARFDEATNLKAGETLTRAGAKVYYSYPGIKVHAKLLLIEAEDSRKPSRYAYLSTGNFNEKTARVYADHGLFTADKRLTRDVRRVFDLLERKIITPGVRHLFVAPFDLRERFTQLIDQEIKLAASGKGGSVAVKLNSLEDKTMIDKLREAEKAGVRVRLIVRGIFCMNTEQIGQGKQFVACSIVDRYLEHARVFFFGNDGDEICMIASADWMGRNLDRRIEVAIPVYDANIRQQLKRILRIQLGQNAKARLLDGKLENPFRYKAAANSPQVQIYNLIRDDFQSN